MSIHRRALHRFLRIFFSSSAVKGKRLRSEWRNSYKKGVQKHRLRKHSKNIKIIITKIDCKIFNKLLKNIELF